MKKKIVFGFHAVLSRIRHDKTSVDVVYINTARRDKRMQDFLSVVKEKQIKWIDADDVRLDRLAGTKNHQGVVAQVEPIAVARTIDEVLDMIEGPPLLLILDGVTDPHNLGACFRVADGVGAHAIIAPRDKSVGINATVEKVASGAAERVPYIMVTNLARAIKQLKENQIWIVGTDDQAQESLYDVDYTGGIAFVMGSEGEGMRRLTKESCDYLVSIPMKGSVESLNISVATGVCLYEALRQRQVKGNH